MNCFESKKKKKIFPKLCNSMKHKHFYVFSALFGGFLVSRIFLRCMTGLW